MVIHNTQMSTSPAGKTQRAVAREDQTQRKPRGRQGRAQKIGSERKARKGE